MSPIPPSQLQGHLKGPLYPPAGNWGAGREGAENTRLVSKINTWGWQEDSPPKSLPFHPPHFRYRKRCALSPIEKPHLKIDYTIKMAGVGDRETWSTGWRGPPDGDHSPQKTLHWEVRDRTPGVLADTGMASQGEKNKRDIHPWPKRCLTKDRLSERKAGGWEFLSQGCESVLAKTSKPLNGTNSSWTLGDNQE